MTIVFLGPTDGGTAIIIRGINLGVSFNDIQNAIITLGGVQCSSRNVSYVSGRQFVCETTDFSTPGNKYLNLRIGARETTFNIPFRVVHSTITSISPTFGPVAGGSLMTVFGMNLDIGNQEDTRVFLEINGIDFPCNIQ